jgi:hypothetical protein
MEACPWCSAELAAADTVCPKCGQRTRLTLPSRQEIAAKRAASPPPAFGKKHVRDGGVFEWLVAAPFDLLYGLVTDNFAGWLVWPALLFAVPLLVLLGLFSATVGLFRSLSRLLRRRLATSGEEQSLR